VQTIVVKFCMIVEIIMSWCVPRDDKTEIFGLSESHLTTNLENSRPKSKRSLTSADGELAKKCMAWVSNSRGTPIRPNIQYVAFCGIFKYRQL